MPLFCHFFCLKERRKLLFKALCYAKKAMVFAGKYTAFWVLNQIGAKTFLSIGLYLPKGSKKRVPGREQRGE